MKNKLQQFKQDILRQLGEVVDISLLQELEKKYLGRKGELTLLLKDIGNLPAEEKKAVGKLANGIRAEIQAKLAAVKQRLGVSQADKFFDATLPGEKIKAGHLHPLTQVQRELEKIFTSMGFMVLDGPELESDYYNFEALNIPAHHPARDLQDTFYIDHKNQRGEYDLVMRTHTSSVQVRAMERYGAPLRCAVLGKIYRQEATDQRHEHTFYQIEGLMVDKDVSAANLMAVLQTMFVRLFGPGVKIRLRPGYFSFVEPGVEVEMSCLLCQGKGCPVCKQTGWVEMLGAGLVHPNVLRFGGIDPKIYSGFAFGTGIERLAMMKYGIDDIRLFHSGDLHFLQQF
ncbi:phenylalanine--tRNA ligase subunit alpha [Candidatus Falkowbacteria bacterium RIFCSPLOWO2_12_FULL_45_10]|uniref:Phenylalanine--tRNA ligase alpha subunit n=2 Tax=Candidatus Falkowiibacteriota TaxID=1752728 RepID=A0A1F5RXD1_9BACT|nr:MAG: phenylalanine--tRNA ligase subunit alpha [Candidatus Falkowbacteria bacterium RIFCSPLOWO2_12_FULL_45_10]OGF18849.1 MAG: phenylalanine--tRNA ligase subunit alpha [Candidatus Falkowbacteria bacterium RIFCSPLOWO2_02_FULL_45_15]